MSLDKCLEKVKVVQALMEGISLSQPQPKVPSELIKFVGKKFNAWHISIPLLESHSGLFPQVPLVYQQKPDLKPLQVPPSRLSIVVEHLHVHEVSALLPCRSRDALMLLLSCTVT